MEATVWGRGEGQGRPEASEEWTQRETEKGRQRGRPKERWRGMGKRMKERQDPEWVQRRDRKRQSELSLSFPVRPLPPSHTQGPAGRGGPLPPPPAPFGSPQCRSSEPSLQSGSPSHCGLGFFTQLWSSHWKVNVPQGTPGGEGVGAGHGGWVPEPQGASKTRPREGGAWKRPGGDWGGIP